MLCDFCTGNHPVVVYAVHEFDFILPSGERFTGEEGYWAACAPCQSFVETLDSGNLVSRHLAIETQRFGYPLPPTLVKHFAANLHAINQQIFVHRYGDALDIDDPSIAASQGKAGEPVGEMRVSPDVTIPLYGPNPVKD